LGWVEKVLNTPSSHRVHHGINPQYLDRNYGGILVVWDRVFGTYEREEEPPVYGVTHPLASYNPLWANVAPFRDLWAGARSALGVAKLRVWFAHPARSGAAERSPVAKPSRATRVKYEPRPRREVMIYVCIHFVLLTLAGGAFMKVAETMSLASLLAPGAFILVSSLALTGWIEGRRWALPVDVVRQVGAVAFVAHLLAARGNVMTMALVTTLVALALAVLFAVLRPTTPQSSGITAVLP
jgi:sterol desaturase/sphingolipid hydroxylase (fatty acid hydroxylase superfamily)